MILLSSPPLARTLPSDEKATVLTLPLPFSQTSGNTYVTVVYASPPLNLRLSPGDRGRNATLRKGGSPMSGGDSQLFAKCGYLWPSSFLSSLPLSTSHSRIVSSPDPLTSRVGFEGSKLRQYTRPLPFSQMSVLLVLLYASPPLNLRLSPGERGRAAGKIVILTVLPRSPKQC